MSFVPPEFLPPDSFQSDLFSLTVLSPACAQADFQAVQASASRIRHVFGPHNGWPAEGMSFEENLADLVRHEAEFHRREAFAYALWDSAGVTYLGCLYIKPIKSKLAIDLRRQRFQAQVFFWLSDAAGALTEGQVLTVIGQWLAREWPFEAVAFPGRVQSWSVWEALARGGP